MDIDWTEFSSCFAPDSTAHTHALFPSMIFLFFAGNMFQVHKVQSNANVTRQCCTTRTVAMRHMGVKCFSVFETSGGDHSARAGHKEHVAAHTASFRLRTPPEHLPNRSPTDLSGQFVFGKC